MTEEGDLVTTFSYKALQVQQTEDGPPLVLFAAPAIDIERWAGVPQRRRLGRQSFDGIETVGFQREERPSRIREIAEFISNPRNTVQNPLLCAAQSLDSVAFTPGSDASWGTIKIEVEDFASLSILQLLRRVQKTLLSRVPMLSGRPVSEPILSRLLNDMRDAHNIDLPSSSDEFRDEEPADHETDLTNGNDDEDAPATASVLLEEETQIVEFFDEIVARVTLLEKLDDLSMLNDDALGFSRTALVSMLLPTVLVDGQHRLRGAVESVRQWISSAVGQEAQISLINREGSHSRRG